MKHLLVRLYPPAWRQRYGEEFVALLEQQPLDIWVVLDIVRSALEVRFLVLSAVIMEDVMPDNKLHKRAIFLLAIGVIIVLRSALRAEFVIFGFDFFGLAGIVCLAIGFIMAFRQRRLQKPLV